MRYIGNKENLVERIAAILDERGVDGEVFCDFFSGTTSVARFYKRRGRRLITSDVLYLSYCLQRAYIENVEFPEFERLSTEIGTKNEIRLFQSPYESVVDALNRTPGVDGFIFSHYTPEGTRDLAQPRRYFIGENGRKIDAIRSRIGDWRARGLLTENEYYILVASLLESVSLFANVSGVYAAFQKKWDSRAVKPFVLKPIQIAEGRNAHRAHCGDSLALCGELRTDVLYLDPPYNQRQYAPNYHLLETIARYDSPDVRGVTGMRDYSNQKSTFCNEKAALKSLDYVAGTASYRYLVLSYNSEGLMRKDDINGVLKRYGDVELVEFDYRRFKSNENVEAPPTKVREQLYILKRR